MPTPNTTPTPCRPPLLAWGLDDVAGAAMAARLAPTAPGAAPCAGAVLAPRFPLGTLSVEAQVAAGAHRMAIARA